jgi:hypothetical protein
MRMIFLNAMCVFFCVSALGFAAAETQMPLGLGLLEGLPGAKPPSGWKAQFHPDIPAHTQLSRVQDGEGLVLRLESEAGYGSWAYRFDQATEIQSMSWQWRALEKPSTADLKTKPGDDAAIKLCIFVAIDESSLSLGTRLALGTARTLSGEDLPAATLCYLWANQLYKGEIFPNPYTERVMNWVLRDESVSQQWLMEKRDIKADAIRVFGRELPVVNGIPQVKLLGLAIGADADNTKSRVRSELKDFRL